MYFYAILHFQKCRVMTVVNIFIRYPRKWLHERDEIVYVAQYM